MQKSKQKSRQSSIVFQKPGILFEKLKTLRVPTTKELDIFSCHFTHVFYSPVSTKVRSGFFLFCLEIQILFNCFFYFILFFIFPFVRLF